MEVVKEVQRGNFGVYGARKLWHALKRKGECSGRDQVARLIRLADVRGVSRRKRVRPAPPSLPEVRSPDLVQREWFRDATGLVWVTDFTHVLTRDSWMYVSFLQDGFSRRILGITVAASKTVELVTRTLLQSVSVRRRSDVDFVTDGATTERPSPPPQPTHARSISRSAERGAVLGCGMTKFADIAKVLGARLILNQHGGSGQWLDESGNGLHASEANAPAWHSEGGPAAGVSGFYRLEASREQHLDVGDDPLLRFASENALSVVWFERNGNQAGDPEHAVRVGKGDRAYQFRREAGMLDSLRLTLRNNGGADEIKLDTYPVTGDWQMFMARYSGTVVDLWQMTNGSATSVASVPYSGGIEDNTDPVSIGAQYDGTGWRRWWSGDIAGIALFPAALSSEQFESLHEAAQ